MLSREDVGLLARGGTARQYVDETTGEIISRREADKRYDAAIQRETAVRNSYLHRQDAGLSRNNRYPGVFRKYYESRTQSGFDGTSSQAQAEPSWIRFEQRMTERIPKARSDEGRKRRYEKLQAKAKYLHDFAEEWDFDVYEWDYEEVLSG